jgi:elongation factor G
VIAHVDAGKTTTTERILYYTGASHSMGEVHKGTTTMDFDPQERKRGITINSAAVTVHWQGTQINLIDTPGHIDFNIEVNRSLRVLDGAVVLFDGVAGVEPQTETNWRLADKYGVPRIAFVNKLDRMGADFLRVVAMMRDRLGVVALPLQLPIGAESEFRGVIDLVQMQALVWDKDDASEAPRIVDLASVDIPTESLALAIQWRTTLIETATQMDDALLSRYLDSGLNHAAIRADELHACIRAGTIAGRFVPVIAGSAYKNRGVEPLLDAVVRYLPAPCDIHTTTAAEPLAALVFKVVAESHGSMAWVRVYSGKLQRGDVVLNANTGKTERISRLYEVRADSNIERDTLVAGDIAGIVGLKDTLTGHTLCDPAHVVQLESIAVPEPVIHLALEPQQQADVASLAKALQSMLREDPSLRLKHDADSGQMILSGMGELQLEVAVENLRSKHGVAVRVGRPQVAYRETITQQVELRYLHKKQSGGPGQYAEVVLRFAPLQRGEGIRFESAIVGGAVPREFIPAVEAGIRRAAQQGAVAGYPCDDFAVTLLDGSAHDRDSSTLAFELAAFAATRQALVDAQSQVLEPIMLVEVITPAEHIGDCVGDLLRRRAVVRNHESRNNAAVIEAHVPLQAMFGYIGSLRALTAGRAQYAMQFDHYALAPIGAGSQ